MKRLNNSDSVGALISICPGSSVEVDEHCKPIYSMEMQTSLEGLEVEESGCGSEKKRRLRVDQVKALEKNFEVENKLEPERKVKLAQELGLEPRQVAVWFQNRRARWKTKQLEKDYGVLKANYDALKNNHESLERDNESLLSKIAELRKKLDRGGANEEPLVSDLQEKNKAIEDANNIELENSNGHMKDGSSDSSDSSSLLNEDTLSPVGNGILHHTPPHQFREIHSGSASLVNSFSDSKCIGRKVIGDTAHEAYQPECVKIEEYVFFGEEPCSTFFCDDQAPSLHWYNTDAWN